MNGNSIKALRKGWFCVVSSLHTACFVVRISLHPDEGVDVRMKDHKNMTHDFSKHQVSCQTQEMFAYKQDNGI